MADPITPLLSRPIEGILRGAADVIDRFVTTDKEKLAAKVQLLEVERQANKDLLEADVAFAKAQAEVIVAETRAESWLARSWRPLSMLSFVFCILYNHVFSPVFALPRVDIPPNMWDVIQLGIGGYVMGRSVEKVAPVIAEAFNKKSSTK
jgi:hypothetical protein